MYELSSTKSIQTGLFTFYIGQNNLKFYEPSQQQQSIQIQQNNKQSNIKINGRNINKQQNINKQHKNITKQQNIKMVRQRQQKLNKFLSNCLGIGNSKKNKNYDKNILLNLQQNQQKQHIKKQNSYHKSRDSKSKLNSGLLKTKNQIKLQLKIPKQKNLTCQIKQKNELLNQKQIKENPQTSSNNNYNKNQCYQNEKIRKQTCAYSVLKLRISNIQPHQSEGIKKSKSQSTDLLAMQKNRNKIKQIKDKNNNRLVIEINNKMNICQKIQLKQKHIGKDKDNDEKKLAQQKKNMNVSSKQKNFNSQTNQNQLIYKYPRMFKHQSEQIFRKQQTNKVESSLKQNLQLQKSEIKKIQLTPHQTDRVLSQKQNIKKLLSHRQQNNANTSNSIFKLPIIFKKKVKQKENFTLQLPKNQQKQAISKRLKSNSNVNYQNTICMINTPQNYIQKQEKRNMRLQLIYGTNNKTRLNLPINIKLNKLQQEKKLNDLCYPTQKQQSKPAEINFGAKRKQRIFDDFAERKKILLQRLSLCDKQSKQKNKLKQKSKQKSISKNNKK